MTPAQFRDYEMNWIGTLESAGYSRSEAIAWLKDRNTHRWPRIRVKMGRQRIDSRGLKLFDPFRIRLPWYSEVYGS